MNIGEICATKDKDLRTSLNAVCRKLTQSGHCLLPAHYILEYLVQGYHRVPDIFNWRALDVSFPGLERILSDPAYNDDEELAKAQRMEMRGLQRGFEKLFEQPKTQLEEIYASGLSVRPRSFTEWLSKAKDNDGHFWHTVRLLYETSFGESAVTSQVKLDHLPSDQKLQEFIDNCPPFRAFVHALELTWYDRCIRKSDGERFDAGRNDQMMSIFLPYCDEFITAEEFGMQEKCLRAIAESAGIPVRILSYDAFRARIGVML